MKRCAKIVCTIGPASIKRAVLRSLILGGMDVARLNFSHGDHEFHKKAIALIREESRRAKRPVAILQDLQGIKIRVGLMKGGSALLRKGQELSVLPGEGTGDDKKIFISYPRLLKDAKAGDRILLDDGLIELGVTGKSRTAVITKVLEGGHLKDRKGVNLPGMKISIPSFTEKDRTDLSFGIKMGVDYVAVSFVREAADIKKVRSWLKARGRPKPLIAKIEKPEALKNLDSILDEADGLMVARGDLGVELKPEEIPLIQKTLIEKANKKGRLVITATQMLESMTEHIRPTRAEVTDVANAVIDGTDALMLSAETSSGMYPVEALSMMDRIIRRTETDRHAASVLVEEGTFSEAVAEAAMVAAEDIRANFIVAYTQSGYTAGLVSKFRPKVPILAFTPSGEAQRRMSLYWGVIPGLIKPIKGTDELFMEIERLLLKKGMAKRGDTIVITASTPLLGKGKTNFLKLKRIGSK
jgi:pyruvate kinase